MSKKIDRAMHGPGMGEIVLGVILSLILGASLAAVLLMIKPVQTVKALPKEPDAGVVYYLQGSRDSGKARQALAKRKAFVEGQSVTVNEAELNSIAASAAAPSPPPAPAANGKAAPTAAASGLLQPGRIDFRIRDGVMQIGVPVTIDLSFLSFSTKLQVQARGGFARQGDGFAFVPETLLIGSCPLQRVPVIGNLALKYLLGASTIPEDIATPWAKVADVSVEGDALKLVMQ
jgi:hypothetical protein